MINNVKNTTKLKKIIISTSELISTSVWCLTLSWKTSKFYTFTRLCVEVFCPILVIITSFIGKHIINLLAGAWVVDEPYRVLLILFLLMVIIAIVLSCCRKLSQYCQTMHEDILQKELATMVMENALSVDIECFDNAEYYDKLESAGRDAYAVMHIIWSVLSCICAGVSFIVIFIVLSQANILYGLLMAAAAIPSSIAVAQYTKNIYSLNLEQINSQRTMSYYQWIATDKHYAQDIRLYDAGRLLKNGYIQKWKDLFSKRRFLIRKRTILTTLFGFVSEIVIVLIGISIALQIMQGNGTVGDYSLYTGLASQLLSSIMILSAAIIQIYDNQLKIANFKTLSLFSTRIIDKGKTQLERIDSVEFDNVCFTYPGSKKPALDSVSFALHPKEKVAIVGQNGSGKSTIIKLLLRMYEINSGKILINGKNIEEYPILEVRKNFSVYFQDMRNYSFTLRENLTIADSNKKYTDECAVNAFQDSGGADILTKSSKQLDTHLTRFISNDGIELSGGELQKVALARTFFRSHSALILDEPSSNLDPEAEDKVFQSLRRLAEGKLTIFTSHRLSNTVLADRIIVMENGKVLELGTQDELMKSNSKFAKLFRYQQEKYQLSYDAK